MIPSSHRSTRPSCILVASDEQEANDLTARQPEKAKEPLARFDAWSRTLPPVGLSFKDADD